MTTITADEFRAPAVTTRSADFAGTGQLLRLFLRRDRIVLPLWVVLLGLMPGPVYIGSVKSLYTTQAQLDNFAHATAASPGLIAMYGPVFGTSLGSIGLWKAGLYYTLIAVAAILTVIRHTRVEEETGRAELIGSTRIGRYAGLTAALLMTGFASVATGLLVTLSLLPYHLGSTAGSVAFGAAIAVSGLVWAGVAAIAAQAGTSARLARQIAFSVLGIAFVIRAVGDVGSGTLSWLSPLGWCLQIRPFAEERWWVLIPLLALAAAVTATAYVLLRDRDLGAGLLADRGGPAVASERLAGPLGLAWRLQRGSLIVWSIGLLLYGALFGGATHGVGKMIGNNSFMLDMLARMAGGVHVLEEQFLAYAMTMVAIIAAAMSISAVLRLYEEENQGHTEVALAGAISRRRLAASHLLFATLGPAFAMLLVGASAGLAYGITTHNVGHEVVATTAGALAQIPAIWVVTGIAAAIYGIAPKYTPVAWGVYSGLIVVYLIGALGKLPQWILDIVPFVHVPKLPGGHFEAAPVLWLLASAALLIGLGVAAFRRRDLRS